MRAENMGTAVRPWLRFLSLYKPPLAAHIVLFSSLCSFDPTFDISLEMNEQNKSRGNARHATVVYVSPPHWSVVEEGLKR